MTSKLEVYNHWPIKLETVLITLIIERLELNWSPEQISNRMKYDGHPYVSTETN